MKSVQNEKWSKLKVVKIKSGRNEEVKNKSGDKWSQ